MSTATLSVQPSQLKVPGAQIYYEFQGSGPVLLLIPGGPTDAGIFATLAPYLAGQYTVVCYDPRGNSRSLLDGPPEDQNMDLHGDDAAQLLASLSPEPALVLGSSGGAQIGLNLAARYPQRVHTLIAHEPPCIELLPNAREDRDFVDSVYNTYQTSGVGPAMQRFMAGAAGAGGSQPATAPPAAPPPAPPPAELQETFGRIQGNLDFFLAHGFRPISLYVPDVATLLTGTVRIVVGVGDAAEERLPYRCAAALADRLGIAPVSFPGGHGGYTDNPAAFAEKLHNVLLDNR
jgi:pimeloyl-ACP methyl ester carboxylesterase